jgi:hypothetical protein
MVSTRVRPILIEEKFKGLAILFKSGTISESMDVVV